MYPKHEYAYPTIGKLQKKHLDSVFNDSEGYNQTLSYFCRPNVTRNSTNYYKTPKDRADARDRIAKKKAELFGILNTVDYPDSSMKDADPDKKQISRINTDIENLGDIETTSKAPLKKTKEESEEEEESQDDPEAESEAPPDSEEVPAREK